MISRILPVGLGTSFVLVNFGALFVSGVLVYILGKLHDSTEKQALLNSCLFFITFSILFAFFRPISSFDEPIHYIFLLTTLICLYYKKYGWGTVALSLAVIGRETTVFLYPGLALLVFGTLSPKRLWEEFLKPVVLKKNLSKVTLFIIPVIVYSIVIPLVLKYRNRLGAAGSYLVKDRWEQWLYNVHDFRYGFEAIISAVAVVALALISVILYKKFFSLTESQKRMANAGIVSIIINTPIVFATAYAQEARLFALPLVFLWPLMGKLVSELGCLAIRNFKKHSVLKVLILLISALIWYVVAFRVYQPTFSGGSGWLYQTYVFIELNLISFLLVGTYQSAHHDQVLMCNTQSNSKL
jgi:hypothetical protein